jgi:hypothetical protein
VLIFESFEREDIDAVHGGDAGAAAASSLENAPVAETGDAAAPSTDDPAPASPDPSVVARGWSKRRIEQNGRRFNIELAPKVRKKSFHSYFSSSFGSLKYIMFDRSSTRAGASWRS